MMAKEGFTIAGYTSVYGRRPLGTDKNLGGYVCAYARVCVTVPD